MPITTLPTPPSRQNPTTFADDADNFLGALPTFATEANALEVNVNAKEASAVSASQTAQTARDEAVQARDEAVGAVATLPDGIINDGTVSATDTWSSQKIANEIQNGSFTLAQAQATALLF